MYALSSLVGLGKVGPYTIRKRIITLVSQSIINWSAEVARTVSSSDHANAPTGKGCSRRVNSATHSREEGSESDYEAESVLRHPGNEKTCPDPPNYGRFVFACASQA